MRALRVLPLLIVAGCADDPPPVATVAPASPPPVVPAAADPDTEPDPVRRRTRIEETWFRTNFPVEGHSLRFHDLRPFLVGEFVPDARSDAPPDGGRGYAEVLPAVLAEVRRFFREVAGVELPPLEDLGDERLRWLVFPDRRQFDAWHARLGRLPMDAPYVQVGADGLAVVPGDEVSPHTLAWLAATQSIARWKRHLCQQDDDAVADAKGQPREPVSRDDPRLRTGYSWLDRGLQSWFSGGRLEEGTSPRWVAGQPAVDEYALARQARDARRLWALEEILFADGPQVRTRSRMKDGGGASQDRLVLHAAQSRVLVDTLLEGEGGRWRAGFGALLRREIRAVTGKAYLLEAFGLPKRSEAPEVRRWIGEVESACLARLDAPPADGK